ncbi:metallophosphoesterase family protein [Aquimarina litoralis]|uniref:metallophosphoesterase family protein n=1 Tax=Aquimarina litoralis TaxID=584605 RepID=UPI0031DEA702
MSKKFAYITDVHLDEEFPKSKGVDARKNWEKVLEDISKRGITQIVIGGDIGARDSLSWFFKSLEPYDWFISLGNHDSFSSIFPYWKEQQVVAVDTSFYSIETDFFKYIFLDSSKEIVDQEQLDWFQKESIISKKIVLFVHHPILPVSTLTDKKFFLEGREKIRSILHQIPNDVFIFSGHYHMQDNRLDKNINQYITPAVSYQVEKDPDEVKINNDSFGYRIIELEKDQLFAEVILF